MIRAEKSDVVLLDNIELLFAVEFAQDPLRLLQSLSRNVTIVAAWPVPSMQSISVRPAGASRNAPISGTPSGDRQSR